MFGWVPFEASRALAEHLGVSENLIYGLLTFYADFRTRPPGNHFMLLCHGTACYVAGSQRLVDELQTRYGIAGDETTADGELTVQIVNGCLGVCDLAPLVQVDHHDYHGHLDVASSTRRSLRSFSVDRWRDSMTLTDRDGFERYSQQARDNWQTLRDGSGWVVDVGISECSLPKGAGQTFEHLRLTLERLRA